MTNENQFVMKLKVTAGMSNLVGEILREIDGVDGIEQLTPECLRITYDINQTSWAKLRERLQTKGAYSNTGLFSRWRDGWREFVEQNTRDNLSHKPACCSKPPSGGRH